MWREKVNIIMALKGGTRVNGKVASERTQTLTKEVVCAAIRRLHELGYKIQDPKNLGERHIEVLVRDWWYCKKKKVKTIQNELSRLRVFAAKLGKPGMVGRLEKYLPDEDPASLIVRSAAKSSKAWSAHGIDMVAKFVEVDQRDAKLALMLRLELAFGLRREEVLKCNPHVQDCGSYLQVFPGMGKGGRARTIPVASAAQRQLLDFVKSRSPKNRPLGWEYMASGAPASLEQNIRRYENLMASLGLTKSESGVTGHGLRAQFAENHSLLLGLIPPTLASGAGRGDLSDLRVSKEKVAQALGHNRPSIMAAYIGRFDRHSEGQCPTERVAAIRAGLACIGDFCDEIPLGSRLQDCVEIGAILARAGLTASYRQIHEIWSRHSRRNGVDWAEPGEDVLIAFEVQSLILIAGFSTVVKEK
jgi:integrase